MIDRSMNKHSHPYHYSYWHGIKSQIKIKAQCMAYSDDQQVYRLSLMFNKLELPLGCKTLVSI